MYLFISSACRISGFGVYVWRSHSLQNTSKVFFPVQMWGQIKVISVWPNPQWETEHQRLINAHNYSWFRFEECVSSTLFSWDNLSLQNTSCIFILHLHLQPIMISLIFKILVFFMSLLYSSFANWKWFIQTVWLGLAEQATAKRISRCACECVGSSKSWAPMITPKQVAHSLAIAKQKAPYSYSSCYISFPRDSFRCKFIYRGRWDEMCNRHTWLTRILYL